MNRTNPRWILILTLATTAPARAGWFGPSNYEECLLEHLKGVTSNAAAVGIAQACRTKFPLPPPPPPTAEEMALRKQESDRCKAKALREDAEWEAGQDQQKRAWQELASQNPYHSCFGLP